MLELMSKNSRSVEKRGVFLASNPALDFLNTEWPTASGGKEDFFETDEDVFSWLRQAGLASEGVEEVRPTGALLRAARALRAVLRSLVEDAHDVITFEDFGDGQTKLTLMIGNESMESARNSGEAEGWNQILDKVAAVVAGLAQAK